MYPLIYNITTILMMASPNTDLFLLFLGLAASGISGTGPSFTGGSGAITGTGLGLISFLGFGSFLALGSFGVLGALGLGGALVLFFLGVGVPGSGVLGADPSTPGG